MQTEPKESSIIAGFGLAVLCNVILLPITLLVAGTLVPILSLAPLLFIGVIQWIYVIPLMIWYLRSGRKPMAQGLLIGAGITLLINGSCWGVLFWPYG